MDIKTDTLGSSCYLLETYRNIIPYKFAVIPILYPTINIEKVMLYLYSFNFSIYIS